MRIEQTLRLTDDNGDTLSLNAGLVELVLIAVHGETDPTLEGFHHDSWYFEHENLLVEAHHTGMVVLMMDDKVIVVQDYEVKSFIEELHKFNSQAGGGT